MIERGYFFINVFGLALGTVIIRGLFIALSGKIEISSKVKELFTFIPAAILPAFIIPGAFLHQGQVDWLMGKERFLILLASVIACAFVRNTLFVITFGLVLLFLVTYNF